MTRSVRIVCVTAGLVGAGAVFGGIAGAAALWIVFALSGAFIVNQAGVLMLAVYTGIPLGAVGLPVMTWVLLRRVALGRVIVLSVAGTVVGGVLGASLSGDQSGRGLQHALERFIIGGVMGAVVGFVATAVLMWLAVRRSPRPGTVTTAGAP